MATKTQKLAIYGEPSHQGLYAFDKDDNRLPKLTVITTLRPVGRGTSQFNGRKVVIMIGENNKTSERFSDFSVRERIF